MNAHALMKGRRISGSGLFITTAGVFFAITADAHAVGPDLKVALFAPARGHYAKLAQLDPYPANPDLPIDAERWITNPKSIERIEQTQPEFVKVPLETFTLPPCPANSSKQTRSEIDYLLRLQANRTEAEGERALYFAPWGYCPTTKHCPTTTKQNCPTIKSSCPEFTSQQRNLFYVGRSIGSWFNPDDLPVTVDVLGRVWRDASYYMWRLKFKYARVRPYNIDPKVKPLQEPNWAAFPSGHSFYAHMLAYLYSELAPEFSDIFLNDARAIAHSREIIGVHFPSDSEAGRVLARQFVDQLFLSEKFRPELEKIKKEWIQVRTASAD
jgi:acid phosphatase (class A)